jgi:hypothetical protein
MTTMCGFCGVAWVKTAWGRLAYKAVPTASASKDFFIDPPLGRVRPLQCATGDVRRAREINGAATQASLRSLTSTMLNSYLTVAQTILDPSLIRA